MSELWIPQPKQRQVLESDCDEILFGGAKGGGKSDVLLFGALRFIHVPTYKALLVRRTFPRLKEIIDRSMIFTKLRGRYNKTEKTWIFPSGAKVIFGHCQHEGDELNYQGHQYHYIGFDQVEEFTETQFDIIAACGRHVDDIPIFIRCTANPGGVGRIWVKRRWIEGRQPGKVYSTTTLILGHPIVRRQIFIPSNIYDNQMLISKNPEYLVFLLSLPDKYRQMYLEGNFSIEDDPDQLIEYPMLLNAKSPAPILLFEETFIGVDVARYGDDKTEFAYLQGTKLVKIEEYSKLDINQTAALLMKKIREEHIPPENIGVDTVGLGAGVFDLTRSSGFMINEINGGSRPFEFRGEKWKFRNLRAQMHWYFREMLRNNEFFIGIEDREFEEEALSVKYNISSEKMISIESKERIKERIGRSTNKLDAVVYAAFIRILRDKLRPHIY